MENKNLIIIAVAIIAIIAIVGAVFVSGVFNGSKDLGTTPFKTDFMEGAFVGNVSLVDGKQKYMHSYEDKEHKITYNISTVDNSTALMDIYEFQGLSKPEERNFNGNDWNIYFTQGIPGNNTTANENNTMNIVICQSQGEKQGYLVYMIMDPKSDINSTSNIYGKAYTDYVQPLLESITLKESKGVPKISQELGISDDEFAKQMDLLYQIKAGNTSALKESNR
ncbi:hypothetical protein [Methanobrevibacter sp.]|uniref:hypothetical protein n=1 Tax=Methanobrevibacter sp. TaxID=66852 RepID=UPI00388D4D0D